MSRLGYPDYSVGDRVYCLAWIGQPFDVVAKDDERQAISVETPPAWPTSAQFDIFPETMFLLTQEHWDQIWHWPDQAGEVYFDVFQRFVDRHRVGQVVAGYQVPDGLMALGATKIDLDAKPAMMFRIDALDEGFGQIRMHPVAAVDPGGELISSPTEGIADDAWQRSGPMLPLRMMMRRYRWCLTFGELVLNWQDLS